MGFGKWLDTTQHQTLLLKHFRGKAVFVRPSWPEETRSEYWSLNGEHQLVIADTQHRFTHILWTDIEERLSAEEGAEGAEYILKTYSPEQLLPYVLLEAASKMLRLTDDLKVSSRPSNIPPEDYEFIRRSEYSDIVSTTNDMSDADIYPAPEQTIILLRHLGVPEAQIKERFLGKINFEGMFPEYADIFRSA